MNHFQLQPAHRFEIPAADREDVFLETSAEAFDRLAYAEEALALVKPEQTRIAVCSGTARVDLQTGRQWKGRDGSRWAILSVPPTASRRAIAVAVVALVAEGGRRVPPFAVDTLLAKT